MHLITRRSGGLHRVALAAVAALSISALVATTAEAKVFKVTGGEAALTPSSQLTEALSNNGVAVEAIPPATLDGGGVLSMPVVGGRVVKPSLRGFIALGGGVKFSKGSRSVSLTRMLAVKTRGGAWLSARVGKRRIVVARFLKITKSVSGNTATINADAVLSAPAAAQINARAGHHVVSRGFPLGSVSATVTVG